SPHRAQPCALWQGRDPSKLNRNEPHMMGLLRNASATHLGCIEVFHLDEAFRPARLSFLSLDEIISCDSRNGARRIVYEDGRQEIVQISMLYGTSWMTGQGLFHDGSMTLFYFHWQVPELDMSVGVGYGQQDLVIRASGDTQETLLGISSVAAIQPALDTTDLRFEAKCRARGIDPVAARRSAPVGRG
ncbi:MAG TPA: hypothetical protein VKT77_19340, partial [Chthonomonadaceae bacterium]|nr:hypothetical protein [Chthonomonadaceae bacterium]